MSEQCRVLVQIGERRRPVVVSNVTDVEQDCLQLEVRKAFSDVISKDEFFLQYLLKDEECGDQFVDVLPGHSLANRSIIRAVLKKKVQ